MDDTSGVGVIDKSVRILDAASRGPISLAELTGATGIPRPTAHRLAVALEQHGLLARDDEGRFVIGSRLLSWGGEADPLSALAQPVVVELRDRTGVSAQVYRRHGDRRQCLAAAEPSSGLRDGVPVGSMLTMLAGSAAQVLIAWLPAPERTIALRGAAFSDADLERCRERGWAHSLGQREPGVGSMSAPVTDSTGEVIAAVSVSGPIDRLLKPTRAQTRALLDAARALSAATG
jgi:DNA-binding IclR family transcriptional regulator